MPPRFESITYHDLDAELFAEAHREGHRFLDRLGREWEEGTNRFDKRGEVLVGVLIDNRCAGLGGLNVDPFAGDSGVGRIRHVYVRPRHRRTGIGVALVEALLGHARGCFSVVRLRTENPLAARLYERLDFRPVRDPDATHVLYLERDRRKETV